MEHLLLKATTTAATDQGVFEAIISSPTIDREKDIVSAQGMVDALHKWVPLGKNLPLAWHHSTRPEDQIGYIDPSTARVGMFDGQPKVVASGWIDQTVQTGKDAWRLVKLGTLGFSFGYLVTEGGAVPRKGGGRMLNEFDVFEVTATPIPMNADTRVLGWKADRTAEELRADADAYERELVGDGPAVAIEAETPPTPRATPPGAEELRRRAAAFEREQGQESRRREADGMPDVPAVTVENPETPPPRSAPRGAEELRRRGEALEHEQGRDDRWREAAGLPDVPAVALEAPAAPVPAPAPRLGAEELRRRAEQFESEQRLDDRRLLPDAPAVALETPEAPTAPPARPSADELRRRAEQVEFEQDLDERRRVRHSLPEVPRVELEEESVEEAVEIPEADAQRERAMAFAGDAAKSVRAGEEQGLPDVPDEKAWSATAHPRAGAGSPTGGQFVTANSSSKTDVKNESVRKGVEKRLGGKLTDANIREFQRQHGLVVDGKIGVQTAAALLGDRNAKKVKPGALTAADKRRLAQTKAIDPADQDARAAELADEAAKALRDDEERQLPNLETKVTPEPFSTSRTSNWVARAGGLPPYIQHIAHDLVDERGMTESQAIATAISICKRWAAGGGGVSADTKAKAAAAIAEWERMKASHGKAVFTEAANPGAVCETLYGRRIGKVTHGHKAIDPAGQRAYADELEREQDGTALLRITVEEMDGLAGGELKAVWSASSVNDLPDSAFLYVEPGGKKDADGKTVPRSLRHFPYKDSAGNVDLPHLRNALSRIPQSNLSDSLKAQLTKRAQAILDKQGKAVIDREQKLLEAEDILARKAEETNRAREGRFVDPLRERAKAVELEFTSGGESERKPPPPQPVPTPRVPELSLDALQRKARDEMLVALSGVDDP